MGLLAMAQLQAPWITLLGYEFLLFNLLLFIQWAFMDSTTGAIYYPYFVPVFFIMLIPLSLLHLKYSFFESREYMYVWTGVLVFNVLMLAVFLTLKMVHWYLLFPLPSVMLCWAAYKRENPDGVTAVWKADPRRGTGIWIDDTPWERN